MGFKTTEIRKINGNESIGLGIRNNWGHTKTCSSVFRAEVFTTAKEWIQLKRPITDKWINKSGTFIQWNIIQP